MNRAHRGLVAVCTALLVGSSVPTAALADTPAQVQAQLDQAEARLNELYENTEAMSSALNKTVDDLTATQANIDDTNAQIEVEQEELSDAQKVLRQTMAEHYKEGQTNLLSLVFSSSSLEDLVSRVYYANKVSETYNQQIHAVREIQDDLTQQKSALEMQKAQLEQLRDEQQTQKSQLEASAAQAESYVNGLSSELQEALAAQTAARAEAARAEAATALEAAGGSVETGANDTQSKPQATEEVTKPKDKSDDEQQETQKPQEQREPEPEPEPAPEEQPEQEEEQPQQNEQDSDVAEEETPAASGLSNMEARTAVVNYVLAQLDKPYVWATHGPDSFDCSGLTGAAYESIGYFVGYSDAYQEQYCNKPASEAVYGDIVWRPGHVGICIGGGVTVEAHSPAAGIGYGSIDNFQRSGSPLG